MWTTSQPKINRPTDHTLCVLLLTCTSSKKVLVFVITFFTILRVAWLLHPYQVEKYLSVHNKYYSTSTPTLTSSYPLSSTMTVITHKEIKGASSAISLASKHTQNAAKNRNTISSSFSSTKNMINGATSPKTILIVSPTTKPLNPVFISLLENKVNRVISSKNQSSTSDKSLVELSKDISNKGPSKEAIDSL